ncbi:MAG TPA: substrate-binding domain-containing protein [Devosia sp.]|nr:substrate-binding domain-containing protein [Devosia sp.]
MRTKLGMVAAALLAGAALLSGPAFADGKPKITMIIYTTPGQPFFNPVLQGAKDAAAEQDVDLDIQYGNNDQVTQNNLIQTAMANKVSGIALSIWDDKAFEKNVCAAIAAGVPVVAFNVDNSKGADASCRQAYIGQDFVNAGYVIGKRLVQSAHLGKGDLVFTPVEFPDAVYATLRHEGVQKALDEVGAKSEIVGTTGDLTAARTTMVQYLIGHPDTKAILGLGLEPLIEALPALKEAKMDLPVAGFDLSPEVLDGIKNGKIIATVDQQPYSQGFYAVTELALEVKYGLYPADVKTGGNGVVDKTNYSLAVKNAGTYR